jgi:hypothetical protein
MCARETLQYGDRNGLTVLQALAREARALTRLNADLAADPYVCASPAKARSWAARRPDQGQSP